MLLSIDESISTVSNFLVIISLIKISDNLFSVNVEYINFEISFSVMIPTNF